MKRFVLFIFLSQILFFTALAGDDVSRDNKTISGHIKDARSGEDLIGATIYIKELGTGTVTNVYGFYSISLPKGNYHISYSYIGYEPLSRALELKEDIRIDIELEQVKTQLEEVRIIAEKKGEILQKPEMSVAKIEARTIREIPSLFGEVDVIRAIQLLPGVQFTSEGSTGFSVRGGSPDQNLVLLDEATVYNAGHLLGFFSVFNNDAVKDVMLYKGDIPAQFGGRLASVLDVRMKDGNTKKFGVTGGIGLISSRLTVEGPIIKEKTSFIASGRRTYADLFLPFSNNKDIRDNKLYFYDFNAKINHVIDENNRIFASGYFGRDVFKNDFAKMILGNQTGTIRWNHLFSKRTFSNFSFIYSNYQYLLGTAEEDTPNSFEWTSELEDVGLKADFTYYLNANNTLKVGASVIHHFFDPGKAKGTGSESLFTEYNQPKARALESAVYISNEQKIGARLTARYGLRFSMFNNIGPTTVYYFDENYDYDHEESMKDLDFYNTYTGWEPRLGLNYVLTETSSFKSSYARTYQYIQLAQNSTAGTPLDIWFPASPNVKPQIADQVAVGYFRNFMQNALETSLEVYYKNMQNTIDFKDHASLLLNKEIEGELRFGKSWSYGVELMVKLLEMQVGKGYMNGWVSYTYSRAFREIKEINRGEKYSAPYDKPNDISIVWNYDITKRLSVAANWIYQTGRPLTIPTGRAVIEGNVIPVYSDRNDFRYKPYHRMDVSVTFRGKDKGQRFQYDWNLSIYNVYNRHNMWSLNFAQEDPDQSDPTKAYDTYVENVYLFGIIPSLTFNFRF
ncbi:MAG: TonB-dependent receptor [Bacteroidetes bacterium]|nr:TonB-dependent receptor [Bacteroidota bacterium]